MKGFTILFFVASTVCVALTADQKYTSKFDNFNVDEVLRNDRLFNNYLNCLLDKGPCTAEGTEIKAHIGEALQTNCEKCTDTQKKKARSTLEYIRNNRKDAWEKLQSKYDPDHTYATKFSGGH